MSSQELKKNLDIILSLGNTTIPEVTEATEPSRVGNDNAQQTAIQMNQNSVDESRMQDPESIKNKGRPPKPKRWKAIVEQERENTKAKQKKKTKKEETSSKISKYYQNTYI